MAIPLRGRLLIYAVTVSALILTYETSGSALVTFIATMGVLFGATEVGLRRGSRASRQEDDDDDLSDRRALWSRVVWLVLLFAVFNLMPTFGWGASRVLAALLLVLAFVELENAVRARRSAGDRAP